jgi:hypothetical protein
MSCSADILTSSKTDCKPRFLENIFRSKSSRRASVATSKSSSLTQANSSGSESSSFSTEAIGGAGWETTEMFKNLQYRTTQMAASDNGILMIEGSELADTICSAENTLIL